MTQDDRTTQESQTVDCYQGRGSGVGDLGIVPVSNLPTGSTDSIGGLITPELLQYLTQEEIDYANAYGSRGIELPGVIWNSSVTNRRASDMPAGSGVYNVKPGAMARLIIMKNIIGPLTVTSAWRSPTHNANVGGSRTSNHKRGIAFDIVANSTKREQIIKVASSLGFNEIISYPNSGFVHVALSPNRRGWVSSGSDSTGVVRALSAHKSDAFRNKGLGVGAQELANRVSGTQTGVQ